MHSGGECSYILSLCWACYQVRLQIMRTPNKRSAKIGIEAAGKTVTFDVYRTNTELADIQIALLQEITQMIEEDKDPDAHDSIIAVCENARQKQVARVEGVKACVVSMRCPALHSRIKNSIYICKFICQGSP